MVEVIPEQFVPPARSPRDVPAERICLRCRTAFRSEGFGERICPRCKGSALWKSAAPARDGRTRSR